MAAVQAGGREEAGGKEAGRRAEAAAWLRGSNPPPGMVSSALGVKQDLRVKHSTLWSTEQGCGEASGWCCFKLGRVWRDIVHIVWCSFLGSLIRGVKRRRPKLWFLFCSAGPELWCQ